MQTQSDISGSDINTRLTESGGRSEPRISPRRQRQNPNPKSRHTQHWSQDTGGKQGENKVKVRQIITETGKVDRKYEHDKTPEDSNFKIKLETTKNQNHDNTGLTYIRHEQILNHLRVQAFALHGLSKV